MARPLRSLPLWLCAALAVVVLGACAFQGLAFRVDDRISIVTPADRETVSTPITITWTAEDFEVTGHDGSADEDSGYFGVFLDRAPQPPGQTVKWFAKDDRDCRPDEGCPDRQYLAVRGVHTAEKPEFVIPRLPQPPEGEAHRREFHEVTVVLLDGTGRRIGETAQTVQFEVERPEGAQ